MNLSDIFMGHALEILFIVPCAVYPARRGTLLQRNIIGQYAVIKTNSTLIKLEKD